MELDLIGAIMQQQLSDKLGKSSSLNSNLTLNALGIGSGNSGGSSGEFSMLMNALLYEVAEQNNGQLDYMSAMTNSDLALFPSLYGTDSRQVTSFNQALYPLEAWKACNPTINGTAAVRSPELLKSIVKQFDVENNVRYEPHRDGFTYCNIYVQDVMAALDADLPKLGATSLERWLESTGPQVGWREADARTAQMYANSGRPAMTSMGTDGHVQVIVPERDGEFDPNRGVAISQAGGQNRDYTHQVQTDKLRYWVHD